MQFLRMISGLVTGFIRSGRNPNFSNFCRTRKFSSKKQFSVKFINANHYIVHECSGKGFYLKKQKNIAEETIMPKVFAWSPIKELMKSCGAEMVSREAVDELISYLEGVAKELTNKALELSRHAQRKKLTEEDMKLAIALE